MYKIGQLVVATRGQFNMLCGEKFKVVNIKVKRSRRYYVLRNEMFEVVIPVGHDAIAPIFK